MAEEMKVALVTGGTRGIGRAIAEDLLEIDYTVIVTYRSSEAVADEMRKQYGQQVWAKRADISIESEVNELFDDIMSRYGRLDVLVNNAGITQDKTFHKMNATDWHQVMDVNLNGAYYACSRAIAMMREQNYGRIINISSIVGQRGNFGQANYAASKAGLLGLTKTLALENAMKNITVNAICPGFILTDMVDAIPDKVKTDIISTIPMRRFGSAKEVAGAVRYLISEHAGYVTGQELNINGGLLTH